MSIFGQILSSIRGASTKAEPSTAHAQGLAELPPSAPAKPQSGPSGPATPQSRADAPAESQARPQATPAPVDVTGVLNKLAEDADEDLDWRRSIVDLLKLLNLDSSLATRKRLAQELGYTGSMSDSASMNTWLQKQVMVKLAEHGGNVPDELRG